jgi:acyl transferase domain-containing protein/acyl carrier protein
MPEPEFTNGLNGSEIAIIGMAGRFPGARNVEALWNNVRAGVDAAVRFTDEELGSANVDAALIAHPNFVKVAANVDDIDQFDAAFFGCSPREAELMDPQHRLFLEIAWEALENAGYDSHRYNGLVGVFGGSGFCSYLFNNLISNRDLLQVVGELQTAVGNERDSLASTVSYKLNLKGPSLSVQTFCSTSLVAVHLACQSLLNYECDLALAGGVAITCPQGRGYLYQPGGIASPDGCTRSFDANARGSLMGNGAGVVVLKRLDAALKDGDSVCAVIKGSAINNDGGVKVGYTAPGLEGQAAVIVEALSNAGVSAETISYLEAHGTATPVGDSIEMAAAIKAFRTTTKKERFCALGSIKTNIGHLDRASGVTGLIKAALALKHRELPPSLHFHHPNPEINFATSPFYVNTSLAEWKNGSTPRRAGVSSFGLGGTNAHVVLEEIVEKPELDSSRPVQLLLMSAKTRPALDRAGSNLANHLERNPSLNLADVAYTSQIGRTQFNHRRVVICRDARQAIASLRTADREALLTVNQETRGLPVMMLFSGVGEPYAGMVRGLYRSEERFREVLDQCCVELQRHLGCDLRESLVGGDETPVGPRYEQAALFAVSYALSQLLAEWGVRPQAMLGYGVGEYVAATVAGVFSVEDALLLVTRRAALLARGDVESGRAEYEQLVGGMKLNEPRVPYVSGVSGEWVKSSEVQEASYWGRELCSATVELGRGLERGLERMMEIGDAVLVEVGIDGALSAAVRERGAAADQEATEKQEGAGEREAAVRREVVTLLPGRGEGRSDEEQMARSVAQLWVAGVELNWEGYHARERRRRVALPTYPFERQRYWIEAAQSNGHSAAGPAAAGGAATVQRTAAGAGTAALPGQQPKLSKKWDVADWFYLPVWKQAPLRPNDQQTQDHDRQTRDHWLIFDDGKLGVELTKRLEAAGHTVTSVRISDTWSSTSSHSYSINPTSTADYRDLLARLDEPPNKILHCWSLARPSAGNQRELFSACQNIGFYSLLKLAKQLGNDDRCGAIEIIALSSELQEVTGQESLCPEMSTLFGACKVVPQEYGEITCRSVDVMCPEPGSWQEQKLITELYNEITANAPDVTVAYRNGRRWIQQFDPLRLEAAGDAATRERGVYLITGGLGGIGLILAQHLATSVRARLVLITRSVFPANETWEQWLERHEANDPTSSIIEKLKEIEATGSEVLVVTANVADAPALQQCFETAEATFGQVNGVIHAAGVSAIAAFKLVQEIEPQHCEMHFEPKVHGLYALERVLAEREVDFCLVFSSLSSFLGGLSFSGYAAANIFIDAFIARHNQTCAKPWFGVNWDSWQTGKNQHQQLGASLAALEMTPAEGAEAFERIISRSPVAQLVHSTGDFQTRLAQWIDGKASSQPDLINNAVLHARPNLQNDYVAPETELEKNIAHIWQKVLGIDEIGMHDNFFELGGTSLSGLQVINQIQKELGIQVSPADFLEVPTVSAVALKLNNLLQPAEIQMA